MKTEILLKPVAPINPERDAALKLLCVECGEWTPAAKTWADCNGAAFRAFYCTPCATGIQQGEKPQ